MELRSEFAHVRVEVDTTANGPRLMIQDIKTGATTYLDPLELEVEDYPIRIPSTTR